MKWYRFNYAARPAAVFGAPCDAKGRFVAGGASRIIKRGSVVQLPDDRAKAVLASYPKSLVPTRAPEGLPDAEEPEADAPDEPGESVTRHPVDELDYAGRVKLAGRLKYDGSSRKDAAVTKWLKAQPLDVVEDAIEDLDEPDAE